MAIYLATKTIEAIDQSIKADQGSKYREMLGRVIGHIGDAYNPDNTPFRSHMGASLIGGNCSRAIWYGFRWFTKPEFEGRLIRLFNRGHLEEARFIAMLLSIGCEFYQQDAQGKQFRVSGSNGHFGGSGDGIVFNIPDAPGQHCLTEFKTHGEKSFIKLKKEGVFVAKPEHYVQMNVYMDKMNIPICLYMAVNKNTDELYGEIVLANREVAQEHQELADYLVPLKVPPKRIHNSPSWYECKFCNEYKVCHTKALPHYNCRTCTFSTPIDNGEWVCEFTGEILTKETQLIGCDKWDRIDK